MDSLLPQSAHSPRCRQRRGLHSRRGYTMSEIIIVIVVLGLLAAIAVPVYNNIRAAGVDNVKMKNADMLNQLVTTAQNGGVDVNAWADANAAITALRGGLTIQSGSTPMVVRLETQLNPSAYSFTVGSTTSLPRFAAITGQPNVNP